jgi:hypothetical protein
MTLGELYDMLSTYVKRHRGDTLVVETAHGGIPTRVMVKLTKPAPGFDWTKGSFIFHTEDPIVPCKVLTKRPGDFARETLAKLKEIHERLHGGAGRRASYVPKSHEQTWIDGFVSGLRCYVTSVELGEEGTKERVWDAISADTDTKK